MSASISTIYLLEVTTGAAVQAELRDEIGGEEIADWTQKWRPAIISELRRLKEQRVPMNEWPESWHWEWPEKLKRSQGLFGTRSASITANGDTQGLALFDLTVKAREASQVGSLLLYVDYLEVAPWNRSEDGKKKRFKGVGSALLTAAVELSIAEKLEGRIGLHSLSNAEAFYRQAGMIDLGPDPKTKGLRYFEMTPEQAKIFIA